MRAWQVTRHGEPHEALQLAEDVPLPEPGPGAVRLAVAAAGLGLPDVYLCRGSYALTPELPFTPGQEAVGVVTAAGQGARARPGERLMAVSLFHLRRGSLAEECLAVDDFALPVPEKMDDATAAGFVIAFHTAWVALVRRAALRSGETLLVLGASGGAGSAALQLGRALGARTLAAAGGPDKTRFCRELGANVVVDHRADDIAEAVRAATDGRGADVIFDAVGGEAFDAATRCIAHEGRLLAVGFASGRWGEPRTPHLVTHNYSVLGVMPAGYDRGFKEEAHARLLELWEAGRLRVPLDETFGFDRVPEALERLASGAVRGKLAVRVAG